MSEQQVNETAAPATNGTLPPDAADAPQEQHVDTTDYDAKARELGHVSKEDWRGPPEKWVPAKDFVERWGPTLPIVRKENKQYATKIQRLEAELKARDDRLAALEKREAERDQARGQIEESSLQQELAQANADGDHRRAAQAQAELTKLYIKQSVPRETPAAPAANNAASQQQYINELMTNFVAANPVFADAEMQMELAEEIGAVRIANPNASPEDLLARAKIRVQRNLPAKFQQKRSPAMAEMGGSPARASNGERGWSDLKPEARVLLDRMIDTTSEFKTMGKEKARAMILANAKDEHFQRSR